MRPFATSDDRVRAGLPSLDSRQARPLRPSPPERRIRRRRRRSIQHYAVILPDRFDPAAAHDLLLVLHGHGSDRWRYIRSERDECRVARTWRPPGG